MILYHGSNMEVKIIDLSKSHPNKDFGKAFYLSDSYDQAMEMASFKSESLGGKPIVNLFETEDDILSSKKLKTILFREYSEEWARFVFSNRDDSAGICQHGYDIVYGPIANDRIGRQIANFKDGYIDFQTFLERIKYIKGITFQYAFCTETSLSTIHPI